MRAISLFSGVGGFDLGLERAGIETVLQAEIDPWCNKVLVRHWPNTRRVEDVRCVGVRTEPTGGDQDERDSAATDDRGREAGRGLLGDIDLVYGGFPCQDLSVAGKRAGLGGERSGLWFEFHRVLSELRPRWCLIENVPGLLSSNSGRDFGILLNGLDELGFHVAWGILDAQHFGVPQRRRRVFIVGGPTRRSAEQVLSLCESCGGNPETGRTAGERIADSLTVGANQYSGFPGEPVEALAIRTANTGANGHGIADDVAHTPDGANGQAVYAIQERAVSENPDNGPGGKGWQEGLAFTLEARHHSQIVASAVSASAGHHGHSSPRGDGSDNLVVANPLGAHHGRQDLDHDTYVPDIVGQAVSAKWAKGASGPSGDEVQNMVNAGNGVRRLTPLECERLQGWPEVPEKFTIVVCKDEPKSHVAAVIQSHKWPSPAGIAGAIESPGSAPFAGETSPLRHPLIDRLAALSVHMRCGGGAPVLLKPDGSPFSVPIAEIQKKFGLPALLEDSARLAVRMHSTLVQTMLAGRAESPTSSDPSLVQRLGSRYVLLSGDEIEELANAAASTMRQATSHSKLITSPSGGSTQSFDWTLKTLCSYVARATCGFMGETTPPASSYAVEVTLWSGWTQFAPDGSEIPDSHRYRMIGNGVASPVAEWIGHRLVAIEKARVSPGGRRGALSWRNQHE